MFLKLKVESWTYRLNILDMKALQYKRININPHIEFYLGDCLEIIPSLVYINKSSRLKGIKIKKIKVIIADIPFGRTKQNYDRIIPFDKMWTVLKLIRRNNTPILLFGVEPFSTFLRMSNIKEYRYDWLWEKERIVNVMQVKKRPGKIIENVSVFYKKEPHYKPQFVKYSGKRRSNKVKNGTLGSLIDNKKKRVKEYKDTGKRYPTEIIRINRDILGKKYHPNQKPVELMEFFLLTYTKKGDTVLDFTMGSAPMAKACLNLGRNFIGIELCKKWFNAALKRNEV